MRLARAIVDGSPRTGLVEPESDRIILLDADAPSVDDIVRGGPQLLAVARERGASGQTLALADARLDAPLRRFNRDILCSGWNYWDHFEESAGKREGQDPAQRPEHPTFFTKGPDTVIGPVDDIAFDDRISQKWDYEAELALVIGRDGRSIPESQAWDHVFGLCLANDVSQRDLQRAHGGQWLKGKSIDATMPVGPWITTTDEIGDPYDLRLTCSLNGEIMQDAVARQVAFTFEQLIAELSWGMTLRAGDVILTGTPSGIGNAREPQVFLADGDEVVTRADGLGELRNRVRRTRLS